jgi:hypothetical protein
MKTRLLWKLWWWLGVHEDDVFLYERFHKDVGRGGGGVHVRTLSGAPRFFPWGDTTLDSAYVFLKGYCRNVHIVAQVPKMFIFDYSQF